MRVWALLLLAALLAYWLLFTGSLSTPQVTTTARPSTSPPMKTGNESNFLPLRDVLLTNGSMNEFFDEVTVSTASRALPEKGSISCFLFTHPKHYFRVDAVVKTWLPRCDRGEFYVSKIIGDGQPYFKPGVNGQIVDSEVPFTTVLQEIPDDHPHLFSKGLQAMKYAFTRFPDFDWYIKADGDSYIVMDNLRKYLARFDPNTPHYLGHRMNFTKKYMRHGYNGGGGYVLSKAAMRLFSEKLYHNRTLCPPSEHEDAGIGECLASLGIFPEDTRTPSGQQRFNGFTFEEMLNQKIGQAFLYDKYDPQLKGMAAIPSDLISVHHVSPSEILAYDVLLNRVRS